MLHEYIKYYYAWYKKYETLLIVTSTYASNILYILQEFTFI